MGEQGYPCACLEPVSSEEVCGAAVWSDCPSVTSRLATIFGDPTSDGVFILGDVGAIVALELFLDELSPRDSSRCRATPINKRGKWNAWTSMKARRLTKMARTQWLPAIINRDAMTAHFQPIVSLNAPQTIGFEALIRAVSDETLISAPELIMASRAHRAQHQFDRVARATAIREGAKQLQPGELLFINFAPAMIVDPQVCLQHTWDVVEECGISPKSLVFEVVETEWFPEIGHLLSTFEAIRNRGARVALDDLGAGHSALRYVSELRPDVAKLDRELLPQSYLDKSVPLIAALTEHSHRHGVTVIAEGVESEDQLKLVRDLGVDYAQGYLLGKPQQTMQRTTKFSTQRTA